MKVINGNNIDILKQYPDNYFDAIVTDPPYGLGKEPNAEELMKDWIEKGYHEISGTGFMGKEWDAFIPQPIFWKEVFRVLKHGGHVLSFFGTRTYDWGVMSMRFAGFEVRDCIQWLYGSGFPKSHNISKAIDKMYGAEREVIGKSDYTMPKADNSMSENSYGISGGKLANGNTAERITAEITAPSTEQAKKWDGWGSALKPANEPIVLARKPLEKGLTIAENVLKWGTGAINIDGCRVNIDRNDPNHRNTKPSKSADTSMFNIGGVNYGQNSQGRFPANLILTHHEDCKCIGTKKVKAISGGTNTPFSNDFFKNIGGGIGSNAGGLGDANGEETVEDWICVDDCPIKILDEQSGESKSSNTKRSRNTIGSFGMPNDNTPEYSDKGGASRFFINTKSGGNYDFFIYIYNLINLNICGITLENQKVVGTLNGVTMEIEKFIQNAEQFTIGNKSMEICQKDMKFIILTLTNQMIELKTCNVLQGVNIDFYTQELLKTTNLLMELKIEDVNIAKNINHLMNLLLEMVEHIKVIVNLVPNQNCNSGERKIESDIINTTESIEKNSRFFYVAKASKSERNKGLDGFLNGHPTIKPIKLMQYLVRLITPPNGIVLDPFCGSGTTGVACKLEGFQFVGLEQDAEYSKIAQARIDNYVEEKPTIKKSIKTEVKANQIDIFKNEL